MYSTQSLFLKKPLYKDSAIVHENVIRFFKEQTPPQSADIGNFEFYIAAEICRQSAVRLKRNIETQCTNQSLFISEFLNKGLHHSMTLEQEKQAATDFASDIAVCLHAELMQASWNTRNQNIEGLLALSQIEAKYRGLLVSLHKAALLKEQELVWKSAIDAITLFNKQVKTQLSLTQTQTWDLKDQVYLAEIGRRLITLISGCILMLQRMSTTRGKSTLEGIASRRSRVFRIGLEGSSASPRSNDNDKPFLITGEVQAVDYQQLDRISYGTVALKGQNDPLYIWGKSLVMRGVGGGSKLVAAVKRDSEDRLIVESEGPTITSRSIFEDWLAVEVRGAYDLYPGSMSAVWSFPSQDKPFKRLDLHTRLNGAGE